MKALFLPQNGVILPLENAIGSGARMLVFASLEASAVADIPSNGQHADLVVKKSVNASFELTIQTQPVEGEFDEFSEKIGTVSLGEPLVVEDPFAGMSRKVEKLIMNRIGAIGETEESLNRIAQNPASAFNEDDLAIDLDAEDDEEFDEDEEEEDSDDDGEDEDDEDELEDFDSTPGVVSAFDTQQEMRRKIEALTKVVNDAMVKFHSGVLTEEPVSLSDIFAVLDETFGPDGWDKDSLIKSAQVLASSYIEHNTVDFS